MIDLGGKLGRVSEDSGPVRGISAVTLLTTDMRNAVGFYEALGFRLLYGGANALFTSFAAGTGYLNLQLDPAGPARQTVWGRVIIYVDDVDEMHHRVIASGYRPESTPADATWGERYFHVRDPDGHQLSFARPLAAG